MPDGDQLYVTKEGTVTSADVETYENDYYSADELKAYAEEMLGVFESGNQSGSSEKKAEIAECTVKDGTAKLLITFPDAEEYLRFSEEYPDTESGIRIESWMSFPFRMGWKRAISSDPRSTRRETRIPRSPLWI